MNPAELKSPIRMYWDLGPEGNPAESDVRRMAEEIALNKFLSLQITENSPRLSKSCFTILETLKDKPLALSLVAANTALDAQALDRIRAFSLKVVFAKTASIEDFGRVADMAKVADVKFATGISFPITREYLKDLPRVLSACVEHKIAHLLLPMQRLMTQEPCFSLSKAERIDLAEQLSHIEQPSWLKITIHDPFLWRAFFPAVEFPNGGCQAANTMLYISPEADVYPCPTLPVKIGNLLNSSLKDIIKSAEKQELRKSILERSAACVSCEDWGPCKGGCRGRAHSMKGSLREPDPACA